jgi:DNA-binding MarR family transcriptional regulator
MEDLTDSVLVSLRKIIRATDLHSRRLGRETGLTAPQLVVLKDIEGHHKSSVSEIARRISLSQATVTTILNRLESNGYIERVRNVTDKRRIDVSLTEKGLQIVATAPQPLQEEFVEKFSQLKTWEQHSLVAALQRVATMMDADEIDAAPLLTTAEDVR